MALDDCKNTLIRPMGYDISIKPSSERGLYTLKYIEYFDKNNEKHIEAFENTKKAVSENEFFREWVLDEENYSVTISIHAPFERIADIISSEFIAFGSVGELTIKNLMEYISRDHAGMPH